MIRLKEFSKVFIISNLVVFLKASFVSPQLQSRIVGGKYINITEAAFSVQLLDYGGLFCGGTLISVFHVVTAAHCIVLRKDKNITVVAGATYLHEKGIRTTVTKIVLPKGYIYFSNQNDIAVLKLKSSVGGPGVRPIGLCKREWDSGADVQIYGWGLKRERYFYYSNQLRMVTLKTIENFECLYRYKLLLTEKMLCAYMPDRNDVCWGDNGSPAIINGKLCGVVSSNVGCGLHPYPGIYTNVFALRPFILKAIKILSRL